MTHKKVGGENRRALEGGRPLPAVQSKNTAFLSFPFAPQPTTHPTSLARSLALCPRGSPLMCWLSSGVYWIRADLGVRHGAPDLARRAVSTLGDSSTSEQKHCRALQINHGGLCQHRKKGKKPGNKNPFFQLNGESGGRQASELGRENRCRERGRQKGDTKERKETRQKVKGGSFSGEKSYSDAFYPAFLRHIDQLRRLSLIINSLTFN